jgi:hypothetical protein
VNKKARNFFRAWVVTNFVNHTKAWNYGKLCVDPEIRQVGLTPTVLAL